MMRSVKSLSIENYEVMELELQSSKGQTRFLRAMSSRTSCYIKHKPSGKP